jgi:hypothetical protein
MKNILRLIQTTTSLSLLLQAPLARVQAQGALTPSGAPAPMMKTLTQISPRTAITNSNTGVTLSLPGSYYLTTNITVNSGDAITIAANNVSLDLNGFTLLSTSAVASGTAIVLNNPQTNISIFNGFITSGITNNGSNIYGGSGWARGIYASGSACNIRVAGVTVHGCLLYGIYLGTGPATLVKNCMVNNTGWGGIYADVVLDSFANVGGYSGTAGIQANLVMNCRGTSYSGPGVLASHVAGNCNGTSTTSYGLNATVADNCNGTSISQVGLLATVVAGSTGSSGSARGISTGIGKNSIGTSSSSSSYGFAASALAIGCSGLNIASSGITGYILNSCAGTDTSASFKYNMP